MQCRSDAVFLSIYLCISWPTTFAFATETVAFASIDLNPLISCYVSLSVYVLVSRARARATIAIAQFGDGDAHHYITRRRRRRRRYDNNGATVARQTPGMQKR